MNNANEVREEPRKAPAKYFLRRAGLPFGLELSSEGGLQVHPCFSPSLWRIVCDRVLGGPIEEKKINALSS